MPLAEDLIQKERETISWLRNLNEIEDANYLGLNVLKFNPKDRSNYFYNSVSEKYKIVLHYTQGFLGGDLSTLTTNNNHVSVPFVISRSGDIIQLFDPKLWSYHLGPGAVGGNEEGSKSSIGIELTNIGPLDQNGSWMWNYVGSRYCRVGEAEWVTSLNSTFRHKQHFAAFTDAQYASLNSLLGVLTQEFDIPMTFIPEHDRYETFSSSQDARDFVGISSHVNYRRTGKTDIGPAFDWPRIGG